MKWQAIVGNELLPSLFGYDMEPRTYLVFRQEGKMDHICTYNGRPIEMLSRLNPDDPAVVDEVLGFGAIITSLQARFSVIYNLHLITDWLESEVLGAVCEPFLDGCYGTGSWGQCIFFDQPLVECREWFQRFEVAAKKLYPHTNFRNRIGYCEACSCELSLEQHQIRDGGWGTFLCDACSAVRTAEALEQEEKKREKRKKFLAERGIVAESAVIICAWCQNQKSVIPSRLKEFQDKYYCSKECCSAAVRHKAESCYETGICGYCKREFRRLKSQLVKWPKHYCTAFCKWLQASADLQKKIVYTPQLLNAMKDYEGDYCAWPSCLEKQARFGKVNCWHCCELHARRTYAALKSRAQTRKLLLAEHGM